MASDDEKHVDTDKPAAEDLISCVTQGDRWNGKRSQSVDFRPDRIVLSHHSQADGLDCRAIIVMFRIVDTA
jgi:hypothetical protein